MEEEEEEVEGEEVSFPADDVLRRCDCDDCQRLKTTLQLIIITAFWQKKAARSLSDIA